MYRITQEIGDSLCTAQAGIVQYTFIATAATFAMMYIDRCANTDLVTQMIVSYIFSIIVAEFSKRSSCPCRSMSLRR